MNLLFALLISKPLRRATNPRYVSKRVKSEINFWVILVTEIITALTIFFKFVVKGLKHIHSKEEVKKDSKESNVIDFEEYKLKKAN